MTQEEFYIGWQEDSPKSFRKIGRLFFVGVLLLSIVFVVLYVPSQQPFSDSIFEYGELTELEGTLVSYPVYGLKTEIDGKKITVPLVGFGKSGVDALAENLLKELKGEPYAYQVRLRGTLIKYKDKTWMELTEGKESILSHELRRDQVDRQRISTYGNITLSGEIVDPKCFFGVMKPAVAKIHRSCAVRCISGGIPPILALRKGESYTDYYFLLDQNGEALNQKILSYVGKKVSVSGQREQVDDWKTLRVDSSDLGQNILTLLDGHVTACN